ncbi:hypothetical protein HYG77_34190 (plasmid) [Rhodococcus sp. ZPP]|uniref:hypothetical protein n=1 Tax=Rhodococcus sp. ZPP TaxID=2749906 RepID=UPI001AD87F2A|nr:hypothetical protein [Rhodococcus sp. ZPP]QTJ70559.1 hypothetical protein HYG77_34190 [Rhodococcus sp. ZPP]
MRQPALGPTRSAELAAAEDDRGRPEVSSVRIDPLAHAHIVAATIATTITDLTESIGTRPDRVAVAGRCDDHVQDVVAARIGHWGTCRHRSQDQIWLRRNAGDRQAVVGMVICSLPAMGREQIVRAGQHPRRHRNRLPVGVEVERYASCSFRWPPVAGSDGAEEVFVRGAGG